MFLLYMCRGSDGSSMAMPMLAKVMAPAHTRMYGSHIRAFRLGAASSVLITSGWRINICRQPSSRARKARMRKGAVLPTNWYMKPPNGGPIRTPRASPPSAIPMAFPLSLSSVYLSASIPMPDTLEQDDPIPCRARAKNKTE